MRLIDADERIKEIDAHIAKIDDEPIKDVYNGIKEYLQKCPTVEAAPVVRGKWEKTLLAGEYQCSNCQSVEHEYLTKSGFKLHDFCPNCGADMRKKVAE